MLNPELLHGLRNLSLAARQAAQGFMNGAHASRRHGPGMEFSQYRPYQPGDDLRRLDWRLAARSDRYYLRESEVDTSLTVHLLLDASASMNHRDDNGLTKLEYARLLLAALAYISHQQGDSVGLTILSPAGLRHLPARADTRQLPRLYHALETAEATGHFPDAATLAPLTARRQRSLTVCVSDLYEEESEINALLTRLRAVSGDVLLLHLLANNELKFSYQGAVTFRDLETGRTMQLDADQQRPAYQQQLQLWLKETAQAARRKGFDYHKLNTAEPLDLAIREFLRRRNLSS
ncbi:DUF58 domain-containing protein [Hymenobacter sp. BT770]|uniref:DUF58 domain-containing protein n=1 Tax=Hymenobacter sp. BT770 TaxID=2886942 RepID=UPI001D118163|nr:DUF58 domain-containing protein [Hymenobacter sp. BT770]MCC3152308.1 DUF58 domain-containing protein [Hymenobacter sp. BT770]MDO3414121.1 DUF58 domain-containing protein [Hymenobacter sp. BT770]